MAKKKAQPAPTKTATKPAKTGILRQQWLIALGIAVFSFLLYANTLTHGYVLDDFSQIKENFVTQRGLSGAGTHFTTHARFGYGRATGELYRPITMATFSLDWELAPDKPGWAHFVNVLLYAVTGAFFYLLLVLLMRGLHPVVPLLTVLFFMAHPTHTEVVANIKSRDEILMFLLCLMTIWYLFNYLKNSNLAWLLLSVLTYTVALFSKENAITFLAILPLCLYFFSGVKFVKMAVVTALFAVPAALFVAVRSRVIGDFTTPGGVSVLDNYLVGAGEGSQGYLASAFVVLGKYLWTLLLPFELVSDLGYNQMPLSGWGEWRALLAFVLYAGMGVFAVFRLRQKDLWSFAILFFLINFSIFTNLVITIGTSWGERLLYSASPGFALALVLFLVKIFRLDLRKSSASIFENKALIGVAGLILLLYSVRTVTRNVDWESSYSLYNADIEKAPNSAKLNFHYGLELVKNGNEAAGQAQKDWYDKARFRFQKAIEIMPTYHDAHGQMGMAHYREKNFDEALKSYELALKYRNGQFALVHSNMGKIFYERAEQQQVLANEALKKGDQESAKRHIDEFAVQVGKAKECYEKAILDNPSMVDALRNLGAVYANQKNWPEAIKYFSQAQQYAPNDPIINQYLGSAYRDSGQPEKGKTYLDRAKQLQGK